MFSNFNNYKLGKKKNFFAIWGSIILSYILVIVGQSIPLVGYGFYLGATGVSLENFMPPTYIQLFATIGTILAIMLLAFVVHKWKKSDVGVCFNSQGWKEYFIGVIIGFVMLVLAILPGLLTKGLSFFVADFDSSFFGVWMLYIIGFAIQSFSEEFMFRGYIMPRLAQKYNIYFVLVAQALIFSWVHTGNSNVSFIGLFNIFLIGLVFGMFVIVTDNIMLASGLHFIWNFAQGCIFGINVSGITDMTTILNCEVLEDSLMTGGAFGIEGTITTSIIAIVVGALLFSKMQKVIKDKSFTEVPVEVASVECETITEESKA